MPRPLPLLLALALAAAATPLAAQAAGPTPTPKLAILRPVSTPPAAAPPAAQPAAPTATPKLVPVAPTETPTPSPTVEPTQTPEPSPSVSPTLEQAEIPDLSARTGAISGSVVEGRLVLNVPTRSQFDGTAYQSSDCGPASLGMVLDGFGLHVATAPLRALANSLQGSTDPEIGVALDVLGSIGQQAGLRTLGLYGPEGYHRWSVDEVRAQVAAGHPVVTLVKYRVLPYVGGTASQSDHYIVVTGTDRETLLVNDPAVVDGHLLPLSPEQLEAAWAASSIPQQAIAFAPGKGVPELELPEPTPTPSPTPEPTPRDTTRQAELALARLAALEDALAGSDLPRDDHARVTLNAARLTEADALFDAAPAQEAPTAELAVEPSAVEIAPTTVAESPPADVAPAPIEPAAEVTPEPASADATSAPAIPAPLAPMPWWNPLAELWVRALLPALVSRGALVGLVVSLLLAR